VTESGASDAAGVRFVGSGYRYPSADGPAVRGVDLQIAPGELVLLTGPTGCGKSTLVRLAAGLLGRHGDGEVLGTVEVGGSDAAGLTPAERVRRLGFVSQTPERQLLTGSLGDEVAFPLESARWDVGAIAARVPEQLRDYGLPGDLGRAPSALSGGQRQRLVTASAMAGGASVLLLDEPLAQLDPDGARALMARLRTVADDGAAVLLVEHRLGPTLPVVDRVVLMEDGGIVGDVAPGELDGDLLARLGMRLPGQGRGNLRDAPSDRETPIDAHVLLQAGPLRFRYRGGDRDALDVPGLTLRAGERVALLGANGSGKSTLIGALVGDHAAGQVDAEGRLLDLPQDPDLALFSETVWEEIAHGPREQRLPVAEVEATVARCAAALSVDDLLDAAPHALSRGQRLRVAVAAMLACAPDVVLLDEPTSGQDHAHVERMMEELRSPDRALLFATHDEDLARRHATRVLRMEDGRFVEASTAEAGPSSAASVAASSTAAVARTPSTQPPPSPTTPSRGLDPRLRIALLLCVGVLAVVLSRASSLGALAAASALPLLLVGLPRRWLLQGGLALVAVVWSTVLSQGLFYADLPRVPLLHVGPVIIWTEGVLWGLTQSLRFVATLLAGLALVASTPPDRLHAALRRLRVPFGLAFLAAMALRTVPETARSALTVRRARARRGRPLLARSPWAWLRLEVSLLRPVIAESLRRARSLAEALDSRGFDPVAPRTERLVLRLRPWEVALGAAALSLTVGATTARVLFVLYSAEVLYVPALRPLYGWVRAWL